MSPENRDLTIEGVLADPMIRAVMNADRIEPKAFEALLRSAAGKLGRDTSRVPTLLAQKRRPSFPRVCFA